MSFKIRHLNRWKQLTGYGLSMPGGLRTVELEFNVSHSTHIVVEHNGGDITFLKVIEPRDCPAKVQFAVDGDCVVVPSSEGEVWYFTDDGHDLSYGITTESFTKLEQRMETTPEMEIVILKANIRLEQRRAEVAELLLARKQREESAAANADPETGVIEDGEPLGEDEKAPEPAKAQGDGGAPKP